MTNNVEINQNGERKKEQARFETCFKECARTDNETGPFKVAVKL